MIIIMIMKVVRLQSKRFFKRLLKSKNRNKLVRLGLKYKLK